MGKCANEDTKLKKDIASQYPANTPYRMLGLFWASFADDGPALAMHWIIMYCWDSRYMYINPLTAGPDYIRIFIILLLAH